MTRFFIAQQKMSGFMRRSLAVLLVSFVMVMPLSVQGSELVVHTETGTHTFIIEIMKSPQERAKGLMNRKSLASDAGMLFDFGRPTPVSMWMKNTYIPLDMIFISEKGTVRGIAENTTPLSTEIISSNSKVRYVLEVNAGTAKKVKLKPGDHITLPAQTGG